MSRTLLITGAGTGIGAATARQLASGNQVVIHYRRSAESAEAVAAEVEAAGGRPLLIQADLSNESGCRVVADFVSRRVGRLDVLVNNAGGLIRRAAGKELSWSLMQEIFALNTFSTMMLTSLCLPLLEKGSQPSIINVTSIAIRHGAPTATLYGASKGAVDVFTRGLAKELAPAIRVNAVAPGVIETPFHDQVTSPEKLAQFRASTPLGRNGRAEDIAHAIAFLIANPFVTGETLDVNGGLFMR